MRVKGISIANSGAELGSVANVAAYATWAATSGAGGDAILEIIGSGEVEINVTGQSSSIVGAAGGSAAGGDSGEGDDFAGGSATIRADNVTISTGNVSGGGRGGLLSQAGLAGAYGAGGDSVIIAEAVKLKGQSGDSSI